MTNVILLLTTQFQLQTFKWKRSKLTYPSLAHTTRFIKYEAFMGQLHKKSQFTITPLSAIHVLIQRVNHCYTVKQASNRIAEEENNHTRTNTRFTWFDQSDLRPRADSEQFYFTIERRLMHLLLTYVFASHLFIEFTRVLVIIYQP